jgi:hypothetical protein
VFNPQNLKKKRKKERKRKRKQFKKLVSISRLSLSFILALFYTDVMM